ncbi:MAG: flagellin, partial [Candidatus Gastranaerophilales bacterium]|nr:flagellin [Candidatus Gastranaerophilales bacterium]
MISSISSNVTSLLLQNSMKKANNTLQQTLERLATGCKINHASDNPAILALSKNIQTQISGSRVALDNLQSGSSLISTADGSLSKMQDTAQRIRDLSVQAANGTYSASERHAMQLEIDLLTDQLYNQKNTTQYNSIYIFGSPEDYKSENAALLAQYQAANQNAQNSAPQNTQQVIPEDNSQATPVEEEVVPAPVLRSAPRMMMASAPAPEENNTVGAFDATHEITTDAQAEAIGYTAIHSAEEFAEIK